MLSGGAQPAPGLARAGGASAPATVASPRADRCRDRTPGAHGTVVVAEGHLEVAEAPGGGTDLDPFEANTAVAIDEVSFTIGSGGTVDVPIVLTDSSSATAAETGINHVTAYLVGGGDAGAVSDPLIVQLEDPPPDTTPPTLQSRTPGVDATDVAVGANVTATFSEAIDPATISASSVTLTPQGGGTAIAATRTLTAGGTTLTLNPDADLAPDTTYTVTLTGAIEDTAGNPLASAPITWQFTTAAEDPPPGGSGAYLAADGQVVIEAEHASEVVARSGATWEPGGPAGSVGGAVTRAPDSGEGYSAAEAPTQAPELRFLVDFDQAGTYKLWLRANSPDTASNSLHVGLDGQVTSTSDAITLEHVRSVAVVLVGLGRAQPGHDPGAKPRPAHRERLGA